MSFIAEYKKRLKDNKLTKSALKVACGEGSGFYEPELNTIEGLIGKSWLEVDPKDIPDTPDEYFDLAWFRGCENKLKDVNVIYPKLKAGGWVYFDNIDEVIDLCIDDTDRRILGFDEGDKKVIIAKVLSQIFPRYKISIEPEGIVLIKAVETPIILLSGLTNVRGFSCFMDSILVPILLPERGYFARYMLNKAVADIQECKDASILPKIQGELRDLAKIIRGEKGLDEPTCKSFIREMKRCNQRTKELMSGTQQDDSEFLLALMTIFNLYPTSVRRVRELSNDEEDWVLQNSIDENVAILEVDINEPDQDILEIYQQTQTSDYSQLPPQNWPYIEDTRYKFNRETTVITDTQALIFHAKRKQIKTVDEKIKVVKNLTPIKFDQYIQGFRGYQLKVVTIHSGSAKGGHYTSYFKHDGVWFYYDDLATDNRLRIVDWEEVREEGEVNGSLYMYF